MLVISDVDADARVQREATTLVEDGHDIDIVAMAGTSRGYRVHPAGGDGVPRLPGVSNPVLARARRAVRWAALPTVVQRHRDAFTAAARRVVADLPAPDAVHAHDFETLALGADLAEGRGVPLVYDSHELWAHRVRHGRPTPLRRRQDLTVEARLGRRADAVITVGEEIAGWMGDELGWDHVHVVRNSFPALDLPQLPGPPTGLLYAGRIAERRELEVIAEAAPHLPLPVTVMGPGEGALADRLRTVPNLTVVPAVPVEEVVGVLRSHGVALVTAADGPLSYRWSLPNKLFQAVQAGVPVVATDLPAQARLVHTHDLGTCYPAGDADGLRQAVFGLLDRWADHRDAVATAGPALAWHADADVLRGLYRRA